MRSDPGFDVDRNMILQVRQERGGGLSTSCVVYLAAGIVERLPELPWEVANLLNRLAFYPQVEVPEHVRP